MVHPGVGGELYRDPAAPIEARVEDLLRRMTLEEKVEQMHGLRVEAVDGLYHTPGCERLGLPGLRMVDGPRGLRAGVATAFPVGMARGATFDPDLERRVGAAIGAETRARGGNVLLAPVVNLLRHPRWGRAQETYGEDPHHLGEMGAAFVRGAQEHVIASVKHFAVNSIENTRFTVSANLDERTLRETYLPHFEKVVRAGVGSVMTAYNRVNGTYCAENAHLVGDILKGEWAFDGFVESDWIFGTRSTIASARAGLDVEMPSAHFYGAPLVEAVRAGELPAAVVDDAVRRVLRATFRFGIFDGRPALDPSVVACPEHVALAREVARKAVVLLKNRDGALPLDRARVSRIAVVGSLADRANLGDRGSSYVKPPHASTPLDGIRAIGGAVGIDHVATDAPSEEDLAAIGRADAAIVVVGLTARDEGEGQITVGDRKALGLSAEHERLVLAVAGRNRRTIVVLEGGSAIETENWVEAPAALLMAWYPGLEGGRAIAEILFGDASPAGRLPITFPRSEEHLPPFFDDRDEVDYGGWHGYRLADREGFEPRFPFGFGLAYTSFAWGEPAIETADLAPDGTLRVAVAVTNTGARAGEDVVQLYVGARGSRVPRAVRELRAFRRVALDAGETRTVDLEVPVRDLAYWDEASGGWVVEETVYEAAVGASSRDLRGACRFVVRAGTR